MICFYYALTAFACAWYFRRELCSAPRATSLFKGLFPVLGGILLTAVFVKTLVDMWDPAYGSGSSVLGVGSVFVIGVGPAAARRGDHAGDAPQEPGVLPRRGPAAGHPGAGRR